MEIPKYLIDDIIIKLYHRWEADKVVDHILLTWKEAPEGCKPQLLEKVLKIEKEVTEFRFHIGKNGS